MNPFAKHLLSQPLTWARSAGGAVRENLVCLTMVMVIGSGWLMAWCKSVDLSERQLVFPALRKDELTALVRNHGGTRMAVEVSEVSSTTYQSDAESTE